MFFALNRRAEADTAFPNEARPITALAPQPVPSVAMLQTWKHLTFLHWPYAPDLIRPFIPSALELDTFDGEAWVGLVPFEIHGTPGIPRFPETNLRTYVIGPDGSRAVWFFSLDAARLLAVLGARVGYHLPYFWAKMSVQVTDRAVHYRSQRHWMHFGDEIHPGEATTDITIEPADLYQPSELTDRDHFLTARFRLYTMSREKLRYAQIEHAPWPLARAKAVEIRETLFQSAGLPSPQGAPLVHYAAEISVKIGRLI
jgi:uncharacterized protein YqjF (DUF2071 family)